MKKCIICALLGFSLMLTSCTTIDRQDAVSATKGALYGALIGAALAKIKGEDATKYMVIGAIVGASLEMTRTYVSKYRNQILESMQSDSDVIEVENDTLKLFKASSVELIDYKTCNQFFLVSYAERGKYFNSKDEFVESELDNFEQVKEPREKYYACKDENGVYTEIVVNDTVQPPPPPRPTKNDLG